MYSRYGHPAANVTRRQYSRDRWATDASMEACFLTRHWFGHARRVLLRGSAFDTFCAVTERDLSIPDRVCSPRLLGLGHASIVLRPSSGRSEPPPAQVEGGTGTALACDPETSWGIEITVRRGDHHYSYQMCENVDRELLEALAEYFRSLGRTCEVARWR